MKEDTKEDQGKIIIEVNTDENKIPKKIKWTATDTDIKNQEAKAMILSLWDKESSNAMRMDLWTGEMMVDEMKIFFYQTLMTMADNFQKATGEEAIVEDLRDYCAHFVDKMKLNDLV